MHTLEIEPFSCQCKLLFILHSSLQTSNWHLLTFHQLVHYGQFNLWQLSFLIRDSCTDKWDTQYKTFMFSLHFKPNLSAILSLIIISFSPLDVNISILLQICSNSWKHLLWNSLFSSLTTSQLPDSTLTLNKKFLFYIDLIVKFILFMDEFGLTLFSKIIGIKF